MKVVVIGGGAAGFFGAIRIAELDPSAQVMIVERSGKLLSKVRVSGGGRCNVTHACFEPVLLSQHYPRGEKQLKTLFKSFQAQDTVAWFQQRGVKLKAEADGRMFPITDDSQTIIDCFLQEAKKLKIDIRISTSVENIRVLAKGFELQLGNNQLLLADKILIATGGHPKEEGYDWLKSLGMKIEMPVPSLFTFNIPDSPFTDLSGVSVQDAQVKVLGSKLTYQGPLLITHWGLSGPAILKLSAWGARWLAEKDYTFSIHISWKSGQTEESVKTVMEDYKLSHPKKLVASNPLLDIPQRLWKRLCELSGVGDELRWMELPKKQQNKLLESMLRYECKVMGKTTFKEEFVTCGGISWDSLDPSTMQSRQIPGIFFAGEVIDSDGITGGFNFQNAWTTAWIAAGAICSQ